MIETITEQDLEKKLKTDLTALFRLIVKNDWQELINSHASARLEDADRYYTIPHHIHFEEAKVSDLAHVSLRADQPSSVNPSIYLMHTAIYQERPDVNCIIHTHTTAGIAVACQKEGLLPISQQALLFHGNCAYYDFEGIFLEKGGEDALLHALGKKNIMFLRNHGLLICASSVAKAYAWAFLLEKACQIQVAALSTGRELIYVDEAICLKTANQAKKFADGEPVWWNGVIRSLDRMDSSYKN